MACEVKAILDTYDKLVEECEKVHGDYHFESPIDHAIDELLSTMEDLIANVELAAEKDNKEV